jgi:ABC-2 type transport system ATP-binding protein
LALFERWPPAEDFPSHVAVDRCRLMIRVENLSKTYGQTEALRSVGFRVPAGQVCGYLGPNGAGKTTTVRILTGVLRPTSGRAVVAGFDVGEAPLEVKRRIGYVPETASVYSTLTVEEYLTLLGTLHDMEPAEIADRSSRMLRLFDLHDAVNRRLDTLSKGMRQKVVLVAALLHDPEVLLLDEPLSGLDANAALVIKDIVRRLADHGKAVLYCSHILDVVERLCDRVMILHHGQLVADGNPAELMAESESPTLEAVFRAMTTSADDGEAAEAVVDAVHRELPAGEADRNGIGTGEFGDQPGSGQRKKRKRRKR